MMNRDRVRKVVCGAAFAAAAGAIYTLSAGGALAWGAWTGANPGDTAICSDPGITGQTFAYGPCQGATGASGTQLTVLHSSPTGATQGDARTRGRAWGSFGSRTVTTTNTTTIYTPSNITWHECQCEGDYIPL